MWYNKVDSVPSMGNDLELIIVGGVLGSMIRGRKDCMASLTPSIGRYTARSQAAIMSDYSYIRVESI